MTHHSLAQYVGPATTSSVWQPARNTGKQASDCWMLFWSMHALSCGARQAARINRACMRWEGCSDSGRATPARESARRLSYPGAVSPSATRPRAWRLVPRPRLATSGSERQSLPPSPPAPCARGASALLMAQSCCRQGPRRAVGWRAGSGGASRRVRARRRGRCHRRAPRPPPPPPPRCRARPCAPGGGGGGHDCGAWRGRRTENRQPHEEHAATQEVEAGHGPQPPQGGTGLHGAIAAAAQRGGEHTGGGEAQRGTQEANCIWQDSGECCGEVLRPKLRIHDDGNGARYADRACVGGREGEEEEEDAQRVHHKPPHETANGGLDRLVRPEHDRRGRTYRQ
eukprot:scaffold28444_cov68-Phaeocystis_antarctica.AAC.3